MTVDTAFFKLEREYNLPVVTITELKLQMAVPGSLGICMTIANVIKDFKSTQEKEDAVAELLKIILRSHYR